MGDDFMMLRSSKRRRVVRPRVTGCGTVTSPPEAGPELDREMHALILGLVRRPLTSLLPDRSPQPAVGSATSPCNSGFLSDD